MPEENALNLGLVSPARAEEEDKGGAAVTLKQSEECGGPREETRDGLVT